MKRILWLLLLALLFLPVSLPTSAALGDLITISAADRELGDILIRRTVANFFGVSEDDVAAFMPKNEPEEIFPTFFLAAESGQTPEQIQKQKGRGWGVLAKSLGLPANFHGKYISNKHKKKATPVTAVDDAAFEELMALRFNAQYYGKDPDSLTDWRSQGLCYEDLLIGSNLAAKTGKRQGEFFRQRVEGKNWATIARENNISYPTLGQPVAPKQTMKVKMTGTPTPSPTSQGQRPG